MSTVFLLCPDEDVRAHFERAAEGVVVSLVEGVPARGFFAGRKDDKPVLVLLDVEAAGDALKAIVDEARAFAPGIPVIGFWKRADASLGPRMREARIDRSMMREELLEAAAAVLRAVA